MTRKPIGSQWLFNPAIAGYGTVWRPAVATIHHYIMPDEAQPPAKNGAPLPPRRDYTVTLPGGLFLFANDESLSDKDAPIPVAPPVPVAPEILNQVDFGLPQAPA